MTYPADIVRQAGELAELGTPVAAIARTLGSSRAAVREWIGQDLCELLQRRTHVHEGPLGEPCRDCPVRSHVPETIYAYLLGLYLGDGCLSLAPKGVYRLRVSCCDAYPHLMARCVTAMTEVIPQSRAGKAASEGCTEVYSYSRHWICLFPQHGPGRKHERPIFFADWQQAIVCERPWAFIRGLLHADGCRVTNRVRVGGRDYSYPRYFFCNESNDILLLFGWACDLVGVEWRFNRRNSISVARRPSVEMLDVYVGSKY